MYGTQTLTVENAAADAFENDVKMYGTQTVGKRRDNKIRLRMM